jgi:hypothetical protein
MAIPLLDLRFSVHSGLWRPRVGSETWTLPGVFGQSAKGPSLQSSPRHAALRRDRTGEGLHVGDLEVRIARSGTKPREGSAYTAETDHFISRPSIGGHSMFVHPVTVTQC